MKKIKLNNGFYATVDDEDYNFLLEFANTVGESWKVVQSSTNKVTVQANLNSMCRIILKTPKGICVTHKNGDGLDNRKENLIECSHSEAKAMQKGIMKNNRSGFRGVSENGSEYRRKWRAELNFKGKRYRLGNFYNKEKAARAYDGKAYELMGEGAYLNFPRKNE